MKLEPVAGAAKGIGQKQVTAGINKRLVERLNAIWMFEQPRFRRFTTFQTHGEEICARRPVSEQVAAFFEKVVKSRV